MPGTQMIGNAQSGATYIQARYMKQYTLIIHFQSRGMITQGSRVISNSVKVRCY